VWRRITRWDTVRVLDATLRAARTDALDQLYAAIREHARGVTKRLRAFAPDPDGPGRGRRWLTAQRTWESIRREDGPDAPGQFEAIWSHQSDYLSDFVLFDEDRSVVARAYRTGLPAPDRVPERVRFGTTRTTRPFRKVCRRGRDFADCPRRGTAQNTRTLKPAGTDGHPTTRRPEFPS
jgi:hypothetical protein